VLLRGAMEPEIQESYRFLQDIYRSQQSGASESYDLDLELTVTDPQTGLATKQDLRITVAGDPHGVYQELLDETRDTPDGRVEQKLASTFHLRPGDAGQLFRISNATTIGNVSIAGVEIRGPLPSDAKRLIAVTDGSVQLEGAWRLVEKDGFASYEDGDT